MNKYIFNILCTVAFTDLVAISLVVPLMGAHLRSLGMSHFLIGLLGSAYAGLQLITSPIIGSWSDVQGHRLIFIQTMVICSLCYLLWGFTTSLGVILLIRLVLGSFKHTQTLCKALISYTVPQPEQAEAFGKLNAMAGIGFMIGPIIGGHMAELENGFLYICCLVAFTLWINIGLVPLSSSGAFLRVVGMEILLQRTDADKRGSLMGSSNSVSSIGRLVGPVIGGLIRDLAGAQASAGASLELVTVKVQGWLLHFRLGFNDVPGSEEEDCLWHVKEESMKVIELHPITEE
ncbi:Membrane transporter [Gryllus bimaculatus]|nr:Membrane transporter [Gryllus bimaculatus]